MIRVTVNFVQKVLNFIENNSEIINLQNFELLSFNHINVNNININT